MSAQANPLRPKLLTFAPMIDSELTRLILDHHGINYEEVDHLFGWVSILTLAHAGYGRVPILYGQHLHLTGPRPIAERFDRNAAPECRLVPTSEPARTLMEAAWRRYNGELAVDTAVVAYFHLLPERDLMIEAFSRGIPRAEARLLPQFYGALTRLFTTLLQLSPGRARDALSRVRTRFMLTDSVLATGAPFLAGDRISLADLGLISAAAPLIMPDHYGSALPSYAAMPAELRAIIDDLRSSRTAAFVRRFYQERTRADA